MKQTYSIGLLLAGTVLLAACGNRGALEPAKGEKLPPPV